jgi:SAM-dependent MidA family methyltransferase
MSAFDARIRREPGPSLDVGSEPELVERIRSEIEADGPITFARFMQRALYEPGLGYYRRVTGGPGREGDFLTAPETHPIFGRMIARQLHELWTRIGSPPRFVVREVGAGTGALALATLRGLDAEGSALAAVVRYQPVEVDEGRFATFNRRLTEAGFGDRIEPAGGERIVGLVIANEVLDALPVHRVVWRVGGLRELAVTVDGDRFANVEIEPSSPELAARLREEAISLVENQVAEICLEVDDWVASAIAGLERGLLLLLDYGHAAAELYGPKRRAGTLMAYVRHRAHDDPFINVGRQDLTAHVDVTAVQRAAEGIGLETIGVTSQAEFLTGLGIGDLLPAAQADPATTLDGYLEMRAALIRLLDPSASGAFRIMGFGRGLPAGQPLKGFEFRIPGRRSPASNADPP